MRKGLQRKGTWFLRNWLKGALLFAGLVVFGGNLSGQTVCGGGYLTGTEVMDNMSRVPGGQALPGGISRQNGTWNSVSTPAGSNLSFSSNDESAIISGFENGYSYQIDWIPDATGHLYRVTYNVSGSAPTVTLSSPSPANVCTGDNVDIEITLSGTTGPWNVRLDGTPAGSQTYNLSASSSGDTHTLPFNLNSDAIFEISSVEATGCSVDPSDLPAPISFTVEPDPIPQTVTGTSVCETETFNDLTLQDSESGVEYYVVYDDGTSTSEVSGTRWTSTGGGAYFSSYK